MKDFDKYDVKVTNQNVIDFCKIKHLPNYIVNYKPTNEEFQNIFLMNVSVTLIKTYLKITKCKLDEICLKNAFINFDFKKIKFIISNTNYKVNINHIKIMMLSIQEMLSTNLYLYVKNNLQELRNDIINMKNTIMVRRYNHLFSLCQIGHIEKKYKNNLKYLREIISLT
jgi:hypothetical protein